VFGEERGIRSVRRSDTMTDSGESVRIEGTLWKGY
jgi:hypothetical protein